MVQILDFFASFIIFYINEVRIMKVDWISEKETLEKLISEGVPYERIGRQYEVSGNAVKKAAKRLGIKLEQKREINQGENFSRRKKSVSSNSICPICGRRKTYGASKCKECADREKNDNFLSRTLGSFIGENETHSTHKCTEIRKSAKRIIENSGREKVCEYCHNHEYDNILEVHHLKGIMEFDRNTTIKEINDKDNLVWLCPNHHRMLELGLISLNK